MAIILVICICIFIVITAKIYKEVLYMSVDYKVIGTRIKAKRKAIKLTQEEIAEKLDVTVGYISQVERGVTKINLDLLCRIGNILDCDIAYFVSGASAEQSSYLAEEFANKFSQLTKDQKQLIISLIELQLSKNGKN